MPDSSFFETLVDSLDKHAGRLAVVFGVVIPSRPGRLYLLEGHAFRHHVAYPITHDGQHIPELDHLGLIAQPPVARNHIRARLLVFQGDGDPQDLVHRIDDALDAASALPVDYRVTA